MSLCKNNRMAKPGLKAYTCFLLLTGVVFACLSLTPANSDNTFSRESGFYDRPFYLRIRTEPGTDVYYTLDGSEPDENATPYTAPIYIEDATNRENTLSMHELSDMTAQTAHGGYHVEDYVVPDYLIDKCTVLRAVLIGQDGTKKYYTKTYFVGAHRPMSGGYVISLMTEPDNLFNETKGIYVAGRQGGQEANFFRHGRDWEREAAVQFFDQTGKECINKKIGIRIRGGESREGLPKSFSLYARRGYDSENCFDLDFFGNNYRAKRLQLETGGDQTVNPVSDYLVHSHIAELNVASKNYVPCELYLNGEYWGFYWICERYDEEFLAYHYGCDADDIMIYKTSLYHVNEPDVSAEFLAMQDYIRMHDMSDDTAYREACEKIDVESYIDYYALMIFLARKYDWPWMNTSAWRTRTTDERPYHDGKWRWMVFDVNSPCMGFDAPSTDETLPNFVSNADRSIASAMFSSLWVNEEFRIRFRDRITEIAEQYFQLDEVDAFLDAFDAGFRPYLEKSWARYYGKDNGKLAEYQTSVTDKKRFFRERQGMLYWWFHNESYAPWFSDYTYDNYLQYTQYVGTY